MKYIANPVEVDARIIVMVSELRPDGSRLIALEPEESPLSAKAEVIGIRVDAGMLARYTPKPGDYVVTQADGYVYLNPKDVFERKYRRTGSRATCKGSFLLGSAFWQLRALRSRGCNLSGNLSK